jgi:predicted enzyme related to lactoylglutathione lyase
MASNKIVHWELMGPDASALNSFYHEMFGWKGQEVPGFGGYTMIAADDSGIAGAVGAGSEQMPSYQTMYVEVESIDAHLAKVEAGGGKTVVPRTVVPGMVVFGMFNDPAGNLVGLVEEETPPAE